MVSELTFDFLTIFFPVFAARGILSALSESESAANFLNCRSSELSEASGTGSVIVSIILNLEAGERSRDNFELIDFSTDLLVPLTGIEAGSKSSIPS